MNPPVILLIEDSPEDREATVRALRASDAVGRVHSCSRGDEALDYLHRRGAFAAAPRPALILLDLNLPGTDGRDVLKQIKDDPQLRAIPVVVLTTSRNERDVRECYAAGANCYIQKPVHAGRFAQTIQRLVDYWFDTVELPPA